MNFFCIPLRDVNYYRNKINEKFKKIEKCDTGSLEKLSSEVSKFLNNSSNKTDKDYKKYLNSLCNDKKYSKILELIGIKSIYFVSDQRAKMKLNAIVQSILPGKVKDGNIYKENKLNLFNEDDFIQSYCSINSEDQIGVDFDQLTKTVPLEEVKGKLNNYQLPKFDKNGEIDGMIYRKNVLNLKSGDGFRRFSIGKDNYIQLFCVIDSASGIGNDGDIKSTENFYTTLAETVEKLNNKDYYTTYVNNTEICKDILTEFA